MAKRKVILLYGEKTVQINKRVPESKRKEIEKQFDTILESYRNPSEVEIDVANGRQVKYEIKLFEVPAEEFASSIKSDVDDEIAPEKSTASGNDIDKDPAVKFERIASLPLGTELLESFGSKGALRISGDDKYYTKRTHQGKLEILQHESYKSAVLYANQNFK